MPSVNFHTPHGFGASPFHWHIHWHRNNVSPTLSLTEGPEAGTYEERLLFDGRACPVVPGRLITYAVTDTSCWGGSHLSPCATSRKSARGRRRLTGRRGPAVIFVFKKVPIHELVGNRAIGAREGRGNVFWGRGPIAVGVQYTETPRGTQLELVSRSHWEKGWGGGPSVGCGANIRALASVGKPSRVDLVLK